MNDSVFDAYKGQHLLADLLFAKLYPQLNDCCNKVSDLKSEVSDVVELSKSIVGFEKLMEQCQAEFQSLLKTNSTEDLAKSLAALARQLDGSQVKTRYEQLGNVPLLEPELRRHCLEIAKEACANAIKHGQARRLNLLLSAGQSEVKISISDNGTTNGTSASHEGKGMQNMQRRAKSMGASLAMRTNSYGGQTLELTLTNFEEMRASKKQTVSPDNHSRGWLASLSHRVKNQKVIDGIAAAIEEQYSDMSIAAYRLGKSQWVIELNDRQGNQIEAAMIGLKEQMDHCLPADEKGFEPLHQGDQYGVAHLWIGETDKIKAPSIRELIRLRTPIVTQLHQELGQTLHDSYCQSLVGASMAAQLLMESLDPDLHDLWQRLKILSLSVAKSLESARDLSHALLDYGQGDKRESPLIA